MNCEWGEKAAGIARSTCAREQDRGRLYTVVTERGRTTGTFREKPRGYWRAVGSLEKPDVPISFPTIYLHGLSFVGRQIDSIVQGLDQGNGNL